VQAANHAFGTSFAHEGDGRRASGAPRRNRGLVTVTRLCPPDYRATGVRRRDCRCWRSVFNVRSCWRGPCTVSDVADHDDARLSYGAGGSVSWAPVTVSGKPGLVRTILIAEDNEFNAELMHQQVTRRGHDAIVVGRGDEVLARIEQGVDLLLLDLHLPGLDGFEVIQRIRARERITGGHLPVIALTARSHAVDRQRCLDSGMDDFISKPALAAALWTIVDRLLHAPPSVSPKPAPSASASLGWLDPSVLLSGCGGDPAALAKIIRALQRQLPAELARARASLEASNAPALRESAHKLCGMIAVVSTSGGDEASALEEFAARGALEEAAASFREVKALTERLLAELTSLSVVDLRALAKGRIEGDLK
jgi:CheY-like chemotaxis protein